MLPLEPEAIETPKVWLEPVRTDALSVIEPLLVKLTLPALVTADTSPDVLKPARVIAPPAERFTAPAVSVVLLLDIAPVVVRLK